jgi:hypothetical protein
MSQQLRDLLGGSTTAAMSQIGIWPFVFLMGVSLLAALMASLLYLQFYSSRATGSQVYRAFPLLGLSITAIFVCIQFSLPLSLGLLGALSIVRFRTPIKEPEEIGFIMLVIAASIATATFKLEFVLVLFALTLVALLIQKRGRLFGREAVDGTVVITVPASDAPVDSTAVTDMVRRQFPRARLESMVSHDSALVLSYVFQEMAPGAMTALQAEVPRAASGSTFTVFFARPGAV